MVAKHRQKRTQAEQEPSALQIGRLISASARLQADIESLQPSEQDWAVERVLLKAIINQVPELLYAKDTKGRFVIANDAVARDNGLHRAEEVIGKTDFDLHPAAMAQSFFDIEQAIIASGHPSIDMEELRTDVAGKAKWLLTTKVPMRDERGTIIGLIGVARNITERKRAEEQIQFMAHHDALTNLPNRVLLMERLSQSLLQCRRSDRCGIVIFMDLDNFKSVNDTCGHSAGDALVKTVAERLVSCIRETDTVARLGGDEFVAVLVGQPADGPASSQAMLDRIRTVIAQPISVADRQFCITCSMGVAAFPRDSLDAETLLMKADMAMYRAKEKGRDNVQVYSPDMNHREGPA